MSREQPDETNHGKAEGSLPERRLDNGRKDVNRHLADLRVVRDMFLNGLNRAYESFESGYSKYGKTLCGYHRS